MNARERTGRREQAGSGPQLPGARERILKRVSQALAGREKLPHPGALGTAAAADPAAAFVKRFTSSGGEVVDPDPECSTAVWFTGFLEDLDPEVSTVAVGSDVPPELRSWLPEVAAAHAGAGISVAWGAVADSGSLILPSTGTRAVQLLPPVHVVWVPEGRVFARLEDALAELRGTGRCVPAGVGGPASGGLAAAVGLHSGPSKSADIGQTVVTGVHGPGRCIAVMR